MKKFEVIFLIATLIAAAFTIMSFCLGEEDITSFPTFYYRVSQGETLWSIAGDHYPNKHTGEMVHKIRMLNDISPNLVPGQVIKLWEVE